MNAPESVARPVSAPSLERSRLAQRLRRVLRGQVRFDAFSRGRYATDASIYQVEPVGVVVPADEEDVLATIDLARETGTAILPRGAGTSQCGQTVGQALVIDTSPKLNGIVALDRDAARVEVQPGVVLDHLNAFLKPHGLWFPVDVSTSAQATLGGMAGNNSCGSRSIAYGNMVHNVVGIDAVLADGTQEFFGPFGADASRPMGSARTARLVASGKVGVLEDIVQVQKGVQQDAVSHQLRLDVNAYRANAARFEKKLGDIELPRAPASDPKGGPDPLREVPQTDEQAALRELAADLTTFVEGRLLDDDANILLRFDNGAKGVLHCSQISVGEENNLNLRVYGEKGGLEWHQKEPNTLLVKWLDKPMEVYRTGNGYLGAAAASATRTPPAHPEGYLEAFANIYRNFASDIRARLEGTTPSDAALDYPKIEDGVRGMAFIEAVVASGKNNAAWTKINA